MGDIGKYLVVRCTTLVFYYYCYVLRLVILIKNILIKKAYSVTNHNSLTVLFLLVKIEIYPFAR